MGASDFRFKFDRKEWERVQEAKADVRRAETALFAAKERLKEATKAISRIEFAEGKGEPWTPVSLDPHR